MNPENARALLERLGCRRIRVMGGEVMSSCPFPEGHKRGDRRPSFSANIDTGEGSPYICFGCHATGTLEGLAVKNGHTDLVPDWKPKRVGDRPWMSVPSTNAGQFRHLYTRKKKPVLFKDDYLKPFVGVLSGYLKTRGITLDTAREWELGVDKLHARATFTVRDHEGRLALVVGRDVTDTAWVKYSNYVLDRLHKRMQPFIDHRREHDFITPTKSYFLYGEHKAWKVMEGESNRRSKDLIVVEGAMDMLRLWQCGWNAVAILGSYASEVQVEKLITLVPKGGRLIIMADGDEAGRKMTNKIVEMIGDRLPVYDAQLDVDIDPGMLVESEIDEAMKDARLAS